MSRGVIEQCIRYILQRGLASRIVEQKTRFNFDEIFIMHGNPLPQFYDEDKPLLLWLIYFCQFLFVFVRPNAKLWDVTLSRIFLPLTYFFINLTNSVFLPSGLYDTQLTQLKTLCLYCSFNLLHSVIVVVVVAREPVQLFFPNWKTKGSYVAAEKLWHSS